MHCDPTASHYIKVMMDENSGMATSGERSSGSVPVPMQREAPGPHA